MMMLRRTVLLAATMTAGNCTRDQPPAAQAGKAESGTPTTQPMEMPSASMTLEMTPHIEIVRRISADSLVAILPMHRQRVANMIAQMNREMRDMGMPASAAWEAVVDSLRGDLTRMPDMPPAELHSLMPEHTARVMRLMEMHKTMMDAMNR